jgi:hypothetical protein
MRGSQPRRSRAKNATSYGSGSEKEPKRGRGRPKGVHNFFTREVKEALLAAVNRYGENGKGKDGLEGFFFRMCKERPEKVMDTLRAIMPTQMTVEHVERPKPYPTFDEVQKELAAYGLSDMLQIPHWEGPEIELDTIDVTDDAAGAADKDHGA